MTMDEEEDISKLLKVESLVINVSSDRTQSPLEAVLQLK